MIKHKVIIAGAGPGDPELLTLKALKEIQRAEVLLYDALIDTRILQESSSECLKIYAGKKFRDGQDPMHRQQTIHEQMSFHHKKGKRVLRLKAGDPMIFGRGMEEIRFLEEQHIPWEMIPGITAANAAASIFGLPITERGKSRMVMFTSAYTEDGQKPAAQPYLSVLREGGSVVFYMALSRLEKLIEETEAAELIDLKVAIATKVSQEGQGMIKTESSVILSELEKHSLDGPSLVILGKHL